MCSPLSTSTPKTLKEKLMKKFLLIDDYEIVRTGLKNVLLNLFQPCEVYESWDKATALELLKTQSFTLVFMDVQMRYQCNRTDGIYEN